jgi:hypothetical protein
MEIVLVLCELDMVVLFIWFLLQDQDPTDFWREGAPAPNSPLPSTTFYNHCADEELVRRTIYEEAILSVAIKHKIHQKGCLCYHPNDRSVPVSAFEFSYFSQ